MSVLDWDGLVYYDKKIKKHIKDKISEAVLNGEGGTVDLSKYATKNEVDEKLSIQQAVGDAGKVLKVGDDGNIELSPKITKIFNTNDNLYIIRSISIFTDKDYTHFVVSDTADNAIKKLRTCFGGRIISCGQVVSLDVVD